MNKRPIQLCVITVLLAAGLFAAAPAGAQIGFPEKTVLDEPIEYCFDQFQRNTATRWSVAEEKYVDYVDYTYHLLLDKKEHIGQEGDVFVYFLLPQLTPPSTLYTSALYLDGKTMTWVGYSNPGLHIDPPAYYSGRLPPMKKVTITLRAEDAAEWEKSGIGWLHIGYGLRETAESTTTDSSIQMARQREEVQYHQIWNSDNRDQDLWPGAMWVAASNNGMGRSSQICLGADGISYDYPPLDPPSPY